MIFGSVEFGVLLLIVGTVFYLWRKKRKSDRTNASGIEQFRSFGNKMSGVFFDGLIGWVALICHCAGILILAMQFQDSWGWMVLLPVYAFVLFLIL